MFEVVSQAGVVHFVSMSLSVPQNISHHLAQTINVSLSRSREIIKYLTGGLCVNTWIAITLQKCTA